VIASAKPGLLPSSPSRLTPSSWPPSWPSSPRGRWQVGGLSIRPCGDVLTHGMPAPPTNMAGVLLRVRDTGLLSQLIVNESCRMFHTPGAILQRVDPMSKSVRRVAASEEAASEADTHLRFAAGMEAPGLEMGEPNPFTTADLLADPRTRSEPGMRLLIERVAFRAVLWVPLVLDQPWSDGSVCWTVRAGSSRRRRPALPNAWPSKPPSRSRTPGCTRRPAGKAPQRKPREPRPSQQLG